MASACEVMGDFRVLSFTVPSEIKSHAKSIGSAVWSQNATDITSDPYVMDCGGFGVVPSHGRQNCKHQRSQLSLMTITPYSCPHKPCDDRLMAKDLMEAALNAKKSACHSLHGILFAHSEALFLHLSWH